MRTFITQVLKCLRHCATSHSARRTHRKVTNLLGSREEKLSMYMFFKVDMLTTIGMREGGVSAARGGEERMTMSFRQLSDRRAFEGPKI